jgi:hypothetical protein
MKQLDTKLTLENNDISTQIKRSNKAAIYKRETPEGQFVSYEVFAIKTKNGAEVYPKKIAFGRGTMTWAWCPIDLKRAEVYYNRLENEEIRLAQVDPETGEIIPDVETPSVTDVEVSLELPANEVITQTDTAPKDDIIQPPQPTVQTTPDGGAVVSVAKVTPKKITTHFKFPKGEWLRDDFAKMNGMAHHPAHSDSYGPLMQLVKAGKVKEVRKEKRGPGKPRSIYTVVA